MGLFKILFVLGIVAVVAIFGYLYVWPLIHELFFRAGPGPHGTYSPGGNGITW